MASPDVRLFVAWPLDQAVRGQLGRIAASLRDRLPAASWVRPESIHLTFAFIGTTPGDRVRAISAALDSSAAAEAIAVRAEGVGLFPDARRPRVAWIGIEPREPVVALAASIRGALSAAGVPFDAKAFKPHLTLARVKAPWSASDVARLRDAFAGWAAAAQLDRVVLYASVLGSSGAVHTELHSVGLRR